MAEEGESEVPQEVLDELAELAVGGPVSDDGERAPSVAALLAGDTLASIARLYRTTVASIKTWNPLLPSDRLAAGQRITVYRLAN